MSPRAMSEFYEDTETGQITTLRDAAIFYNDLPEAKSREQASRALAGIA